MRSIIWIFFDVGSTLVDEEEAYRHRVRDMIRGTSVTMEQYYEKRVQFAKAGYNGDQKAMEFFGLTKTPWHSEDEVPFADCAQTLRRLCEQGYRLGVIANQRDYQESDIDDDIDWNSGHHPWMDWDAPWEDPMDVSDKEKFRAERLAFIAAEKSSPRWRCRR